MAAAFVQNKENRFFAGGGTTEAITFGSNITAGNLVIIGIGWTLTTATISSVKDANNVSYTLIDTLTDGTTGKLSTYYLENSAGGANAAQVTVTWSIDPVSGFVAGQEVSGVLTSGSLDVHDKNTVVSPSSGTNAVVSNSVTTTGADYVFGVTWNDGLSGVTVTAGNNVAWTGKGGPTNYLHEYFVQASGAAITADFTLSGTPFSNYLTAIAAFKPIAAVSTLKLRTLLGVGF